MHTLQVEVAREERQLEELADERKQKALRVYMLGGTISDACKAAKVTRQTWLNWKAKDQKFNDLVETFYEHSTDLLEQEAERRALEGSDQLLTFLLKGRRRQTYGDKLQTDNKHAVTINVQQFSSD